MSQLYICDFPTRFSDTRVHERLFAGKRNKCFCEMILPHLARIRGTWVDHQEYHAFGDNILRWLDDHDPQWDVGMEEKIKNFELRIYLKADPDVLMLFRLEYM